MADTPDPTVTNGPDAPADEDRPDAPASGPPGDDRTLRSVLAELADDGYDVDFEPVGTDGEVRCQACQTASAADTFDEVSEHRLEGASDPADMMIVVAGRCPACGRGGAMTLRYGPEAGEADSAVIGLLP